MDHATLTNNMNSKTCFYCGKSTKYKREGYINKFFETCCKKPGEVVGFTMNFQFSPNIFAHIYLKPLQYQHSYQYILCYYNNGSSLGITCRSKQDLPIDLQKAFSTNYGFDNFGIISSIYISPLCLTTTNELHNKLTTITLLK